MEHTVYKIGDWVEYLMPGCFGGVIGHRVGMISAMHLEQGNPVYRIGPASLAGVKQIPHKFIIKKIRREEMKEPKYKVGDWVTYRDSNNHYQFGYGQITDSVLFCACPKDGWAYKWEYKINGEYIKEEDIDMQANFYRTTSTPTLVVTNGSATIGRPQKAVMPGIKDVIFNDPATVIVFDDGTKSVVKATGDDMYCAEIGYLMALVKKLVDKKDYDTILKTMDKYNQRYREQCSTDTKE